jgi:hypothetical protein
MAGVAGPMFRNARRSGWRFLAGLLAGGMMAGMLLALPVYLFGTISGALPFTARLFGFVVLCVGFGLADLLLRTPHVWRQVPQSLVRSLRPGTLGVVWGFDLGLLFTTQKTTSLIWVALSGLVLLQPGAALAVLVSVSIVATLAIGAATAVGGVDARIDPQWSARWVTRMRRASGAVILAVAVGAVSWAWMAGHG